MVYICLLLVFSPVVYAAVLSFKASRGAWRDAQRRTVWLSYAIMLGEPFVNSVLVGLALYIGVSAGFEGTEIAWCTLPQVILLLPVCFMLTYQGEGRSAAMILALLSLMRWPLTASIWWVAGTNPERGGWFMLICLSVLLLVVTSVFAHVTLSEFASTVWRPQQYVAQSRS